MGRAPCCEKVGLKKGRWTAEEDEILVNYIKANGEGSWRSLPKNAGLLRCGKSCRLRWINYLREDLKRGNISAEEEETIVKLHRSLGNRWSLIAGHLPGRTDNEIKNYWNSHLSKRVSNFHFTIIGEDDADGSTAAAMDLGKISNANKRKDRRKRTTTTDNSNTTTTSSMQTGTGSSASEEEGCRDMDHCHVTQVVHGGEIMCGGSHVEVESGAMNEDDGGSGVDMEVEGGGGGEVLPLKKTREEREEEEERLEYLGDLELEGMEPTKLWDGVGEEIWPKLLEEEIGFPVQPIKGCEFYNAQENFDNWFRSDFFCKSLLK